MSPAHLSRGRLSSGRRDSAAASPASWWVYGAVFAAAFVVRLVLVLRGGGLYGKVGYDGSVYYAAAAGLAHGLLPYRDFLLLHPPGVVLALLPFAGLGRLIGDPHAFALARLAWIGLGALNALLVTRILSGHGRRPALAAGALYAVFVPAVYSEHSTSLEALGSTCLLGAIALVTRRPAGRAVTVPALLGAGVLLGASAGTKIWGVAVGLALVAWVMASAGVRRGLLVLAGAAAGTVLVCLPFFVGEPAAMWRMIVTDQVGRRRVPGGLATRIIDIGGLSQFHVSPQTTLLLFGVCAVVAGGLVLLAVTDPLGRLAVVLLVVTVGLLLATPSWSPHYGALAGPPAVVLFGVALAGLRQRLPGLHRVTAVVVCVGLLGYAATTVTTLSFGSPFPGARLEQTLAAEAGCVTTDDPTVLIETGSLQRNLDAGCPLVADLGGYSYDLQPGAREQRSRAANGQWQQFARDYLGSGGATVIARFRVAPGYSRATKATISRWPVRGTVGRYRVQRPTAAPAGPRR